MVFLSTLWLLARKYFLLKVILKKKLFELHFMTSPFGPHLPLWFVNLACMWGARWFGRHRDVIELREAVWGRGRESGSVKGTMRNVQSALPASRCKPPLIWANGNFLRRWFAKFFKRFDSCFPGLWPCYVPLLSGPPNCDVGERCQLSTSLRVSVCRVSALLAHAQPDPRPWTGHSKVFPPFSWRPPIVRFVFSQLSAHC